MSDLDRPCPGCTRLRADLARERERAERLRRAVDWVKERLTEGARADRKCWCRDVPHADWGPCDWCLDQQALEECRAALAGKEADREPDPR